MDRFQKGVIKQALDYPELLSDWENDFISNIADKDDDYELSEKQNDVINRIEHKIALG